jgi:Protein of unknown function (DUF2877)
MATLPTHRVAAPVLERLAGSPRGVVLGAGATAAWVDLDGFVVAVTTREVPLLPNAIALAAGTGALGRAGVGPGTTARLAPGRVELGTTRITWDPSSPPSWDPTVPPPADPSPEAVATRGATLLRALGVGTPVDTPEHPSPGSATLPLRGAQRPGGADSAARGAQQPGGTDSAARGAQRPGGADPGDREPELALVRGLGRVGLATAEDPEGAAGLVLLFRAVRERDPEPAAGAARVLLGRGPGLTPEGDDLLAAVAGTLAVLGPAAGLHGPALTSLLAALTPEPGRTTALSATLLALAARGLLAEPAGRLLDLGPAGEAAWPAALRRLQRLGHGSGRAYAAGIAAGASLLAAGQPVG